MKLHLGSVKSCVCT